MNNNLAKTSPTLPLILYKYMSQKSFLNIIESKSIWATDIFYLNDAAEYHHAVGLLKSEIENKSKDILMPITGFSGAKINAVKVIPRERAQKHYLWRLNNLIDFEFDNHIFVCSFSKAKDTLSQWRGYCPGGSG